MSRKKLQRFAEIKLLPNVEQNPTSRKGHWPQPLSLELGCGKAEYSIHLAQAHQSNHYIGIDKKADRVWRAAKMAERLQLTNVGFIHGTIQQLLDWFEPSEISELWLPFPDPFTKPSKASQRLTTPNFLKLYRTILKPNGRLHLKTDSDNLFAYSLQTIQAAGGQLHQVINQAEPSSIETTYEQKHRRLGEPIHYCVCSFDR